MEALGVRSTGRGAVARDPQEALVDFICPTCGRGATKSARRDRTRYHFTDGFVQDLEGELTTCRGCRQALRVAPVVMVHDENEKRRFTAVFSEALGANN